MDKKKFYIILLSVVVFFVIGYLIIYLSGSLGGYKVKPFIKNDGDKIQEELKMKNSALPKLISASGDVISIDDEVIEVEVDVLGDKVVIKINPTESVNLISGSYDENGGLENRRVSNSSVSNIKDGDNISFGFQKSVSIDKLDDKVFEVESIDINPSGNPEL